MKVQRKRVFKVIGYVSVCLLLFVIGVMWGLSRPKRTAERSWSDAEMMGYVSSIEETDCVICDAKNQYKGEDNLGIILLNEGIEYRVGVNKYDDWGRLIEKGDTYNQTLWVPSAGERKGVEITTNTTRGYADVDVNLGENKYIEMEKVIEHCCTNCVNTLTDQYYTNEPFDILVLNYKTGDMRLITSTLKSFMCDDYYVICETRSKDESMDPSKVELFIVFCPERYE